MMAYDYNNIIWMFYVIQWLNQESSTSSITHDRWSDLFIFMKV